MSDLIFDSDSRKKYSLFSGAPKTVLAFLTALKITSYQCIEGELNS